MSVLLERLQMPEVLRAACRFLEAGLADPLDGLRGNILARRQRLACTSYGNPTADRGSGVSAKRGTGDATEGPAWTGNHVTEQQTGFCFQEGR